MIDAQCPVYMFLFMIHVFTNEQTVVIIEATHPPYSHSTICTMDHLHGGQMMTVFFFGTFGNYINSYTSYTHLYAVRYIVLVTNSYLNLQG